MPISLVIADVDATLLTPEHKVTERSMQTVRALRERGILFTVASSRPPRGLLSLVNTFGLREPFAAFNGAVVQLADGKTLIRHLLSPGVCEHVHGICERFGLELWVYCDHDWHVARHTHFVAREERTIGFNARLESNLQRWLMRATKLTVVGDPLIVAQAEVVVLAEVGSEVSATKSRPRYIDITAPEAHKGTVVTQLASLLRIPTRKIAVIGDGFNDILMFERAGISIAMGNAVPEVRTSAKYVTAANTDEGFARGIEDFVLRPNDSLKR